MIIQKSDFVKYIDLSSNLSDSKLEPRILEATNFDLCRLMGNDLFYDFLQYVDANGNPTDNAPTPYQNLLTGCKYNNVFVQEGIKPVLVYFTGARLLRTLDLSITPSGLKTKRNEFSDDADPKLIANNAMSFENLALAYWQKCVKFIEFSGKELFPPWKDFNHCGASPAQGRPVFLSIKGRGYGRGYSR